MKAQTYYDFLPLILKEAKHLADKIGFDFEELFSQACLIFCETYNKNNGKNFPAYLKKCLRYELSKFVNKFKKQLPNEISDIEENKNHVSYIDQNIEYTIFHNSLSDDGKLMVNYLFENSEKMLKEKTESKTYWSNVVSMTNLKTSIKNDFGWSIRRTEKAINEIKNTLN